MYKPRKIDSNRDWVDETGVKIYTVSVHDDVVDQSLYIERLKVVKSAREIVWQVTPAFAIFHDGEHCNYMVLAWWGNDNELFTSVSVRGNGKWLEDATKYSFCLYDLEIIWAERNFYIKAIDCAKPSLQNYQNLRLMKT